MVLYLDVLYLFHVYNVMHLIFDVLFVLLNFILYYDLLFVQIINHLNIIIKPLYNVIFDHILHIILLCLDDLMTSLLPSMLTDFNVHPFVIYLYVFF